ncbi:MAG: carbamoyl-phosphate synthase large subunit [Clostridiales bacterium]|jgi:carbamoyl-phosphate synthase large subunit|nr:carbamoyl-phosphate synthase large subunit [Clostridiales bacterium]
MPLNKNIKRVLVIGSGPIVIGQAAEFDYAGTQACRALREDGIEIVLINSNPATIMTDNAMADAIYIEPLTLTTIKRIIEKEHPDSILSGLGGQTGLTLCMQLAKDGFLERHGVRLLGSSPETIDKAEDRLIFKRTMEKINQPVIPSEIATDVETALSFAEKTGYPLVIRPAFTLGGTGGGIVYNEKELREIVTVGLSLSPIGQVLVEKSVAGWKEIEFEVMRDSKGNAITVCSMENFDPVGIHTGDSIVIAPAVTLSDKEYQMLRTASINIIQELGVEGGCNCQFALCPDSFEYAVIEVNPRVSRSSALASKATGYPIAKVATKIALGYSLDEIINAVTGHTYAAFEPTLDYVAVKFPKWPFDKFVYAKRELGTQMKATGEVMSIADNFEQALMKAVRGAEIGTETLSHSKFAAMSDEEINKNLDFVSDERVFVLYEAISRGFSVDLIFEKTKVDRWFLYKLKNISETEQKLTQQQFSQELYIEAKKFGFTDKTVKKLTNAEFEPFAPVYKMVDTCGGEFEAKTPYFYAVFAEQSAGAENEAAEWAAKSTRRKIIVIGSGPIRIGQGIEFDYASVHAVWALRERGFDVIVINNNPETVSTDFDTADRLYFEPLNIEDVMHVIDLEKPEGVMVAFGGGTAIKLTGELSRRGVKIIGTSADAIDICEDRERFDKLLETLKIKRPEGLGVTSLEEAMCAAEKLGFPVLMRPSYVIGGQNMIIAFDKTDVEEYMEIIFRQKQDNPVLIDKYMSGREIEVDAICDGKDILIPGIMEHIERTGIHSGDSIAMYPPANIDDDAAKKIFSTTKKLCTSLKVKGLVNLQYVLVPETNADGETENELYVIEVNPRASRTVPYISKVTGINMCELATRASLGETLKEIGVAAGIAKLSPYTAVKVPVFSFEKLTDVDTHLGPEMKSTGEVLGIGKDLKEALYKGLLAANYKIRKGGGVFITVRDSDKHEVYDVAKKFRNLGFTIYSTKGTAETLRWAGIKAEIVNKIYDNPSDNSMTLLESGRVNYIISTSTRGRNPAQDSVKIRRKACLLGIPCLTSLDTATALADSIESGYSEINTELVDINEMRKEHMKIKFTKMQSCGNDYIYINCFEQRIDSPESLSIKFSDRRFGIGGDGIILVCPSEVADAKMRMFNLDGSEGKMCGNGIRCVAKFLYDYNIVRKQEMTIETLSGIKTVRVITRNNEVAQVTVDMGDIELKPENIPTTLKGERIVNETVYINGKEYAITCVSMGNPHCVVFVDDVDSLDLEQIGPEFEFSPLFPDRINAEFIQVRDKKTLKMRVWERGSGETLACGTGACASVVAATLNGFVDEGEKIRVELRGGDLEITYRDGRVTMEGDCQKVFEGVVLA